MNVKGILIFVNVTGLLMGQVGFAHEISECRDFRQELE